MMVSLCTSIGYKCICICIYYLRLRLDVSPFSLQSLKRYFLERFKFTDQLVKSLCNVYLGNLSCHTGY